MKKILKKIGVYIIGSVIGIVCLPLVLMLILAAILMTPADIYRYHRMPYYKDLRKKYRWYATGTDPVKLYNRMVKENLPIEYQSYENYEYFTAENTVLLVGWDKETVEERDGIWGIVFEDEEMGEHWESMENVLETERQNLKPEHRNLPAKFLCLSEAEIPEGCNFYCKNVVLCDLEK